MVSKAPQGSEAAYYNMDVYMAFSHEVYTKNMASSSSSFTTLSATYCQLPPQMSRLNNTAGENHQI